MLEINPPRATQKPYTHRLHGDERLDPYYWLRERENPEVMDYLKQENQFADSFFGRHKKLKERLFQEMKSRLKQADETVPVEYKGYQYYRRIAEGQEYWDIFRKKLGSEKEEIILPANTLATQSDYFQVGNWVVSPDSRYLAYAVDRVGRRIYTIYFKDLETGEILNQKIENTTSNFEWAADSKTVYYAQQNPETLRYERVLKYNLNQQKSATVYFEKDLEFDVELSQSKSERFIFVTSKANETTEVRYLDAADPEPKLKVFAKRMAGHEYTVFDGGDHFYVLSNWKAKNFMVYRTSGLLKTEQNHWLSVVGHRPNVLVTGLSEFKDFLALTIRTQGIQEIEIYDRVKGTLHQIPMKESAHLVDFDKNIHFETKQLRYTYESLTQPRMVVEYDMASQTQVTLKVQEIPGGYDPQQFESQYVHAKAPDGTLIPLSIVYKRETQREGALKSGSQKKVPKPLLLYAYGSYGSSMDPYFSTARLSLLDRGFVYAIAHVRGGSEMGRQWYLDGKKLKKKNTFKDFIACAEYLIREGWTSSEHLHIQGGSAGGLLVGAVLNMNPTLFKSATAEVPFVDVVTTMLDESLPLTTGEYEEWGNPNQKKYYQYMKSYSPYDNVEAKDYPHLFVKTGLHDSQVQYWEPAKWVAKLRATKTDQNFLFLKTEMSAGHGGKSGRFRKLEEVAENYVFLLTIEGQND